MQPGSFRTITDYVRLRSGIVLDDSKGYMLETRLAPILKREGLPSLDGLAGRLRMQRQDELGRAVVEALTTNESLFFRDGHPFEYLARLLPQLAAARAPGMPIRVWSAACSSGQEAYSVAMVAAEAAGALKDHTLRILGTDLSRDMVERARSGAFTRFEVQRGLAALRLVRFFRQEGDQFVVNDALKAMAEFRQDNLLDPASSGESYDVVFCRNVLIYFDPPTKSRVLETIASRTARGGVLYLGGAETILGLTTRFAAIPGERGVYRLAA